VSDAVQTLRDASRILVIDWPSPDVPESLARSGHTVIVKGGPGPRDYNARDLRDGEVVSRALGDAPESVDLVYVYRPEAEIAGIVEMAKQLGAATLWCQSGRSGPESDDPQGCWVSDDQSQRLRALAEAAGLRYIDDVYIGDAARA
jgi:predicted CoA-binding protein